MNKFKVSYVTTLPKLGNSPSISITGDEQNTYNITVIDGNTFFGMTGETQTNQVCIFNGRQWYSNWVIDIKDENNNTVFEESFNPEGKVIFIKMDAYALGDNIAWIPYVEEFRKKHNATVICSTFFNDLFIEAYPEILFVKPNTVIENIYAQYYIGAANDGNYIYSPIKINERPLQMAASAALGLRPKEIQPQLRAKYQHIKPRTKNKYVTLSEFGSAPEKEWQTPDGWQRVVDHIVSKGYEVLVISKEPTKLRNVTDLTGNISLDIRAVDILHAKMHLGISSGLSWLAWGLGTHVFMISDGTPNWHEFNTGITRLNANHLNAVDFSATGRTKIEDVLQELDETLV